jgi:plastocyanin
MFKRITIVSKKSLLIVTGLAAACCGLAAHAADASPKAANYGEAVPAQAAERTIVIKPDTKYVNVDNGQTVTFVEGDKTFTWHFDTLRPSDDFELSAIAPQDFKGDNIEVYVATNPLYR